MPPPPIQQARDKWGVGGGGRTNCCSEAQSARRLNSEDQQIHFISCMNWTHGYREDIDEIYPPREEQGNNITVI